MLILVSSASFVAGVLATAAAVSYAVDRNYEQARANQAYAVASRAQFEVGQLAALRRGDTEAVMSDLDAMLSSLTGQLANYEQDVPEGLANECVGDIYRFRLNWTEYEKPISAYVRRRAAQFMSLPALEKRFSLAYLMHDLIVREKTPMRGAT